MLPRPQRGPVPNRPCTAREQDRGLIPHNLVRNHDGGPGRLTASPGAARCPARTVAPPTPGTLYAQEHVHGTPHRHHRLVGRPARPSGRPLRRGGQRVRPRRRDRPSPARTPSTRRASSASWPSGPRTARRSCSRPRATAPTRRSRPGRPALPRPRRGVRMAAVTRDGDPARASASARARRTDRWCRSHHRCGRRPTSPPSTTAEAALADVRAAFESVAVALEEQGPPRRRHGPADPQGHGAHRPRQGARQGGRQAARRRAGAGRPPSPTPSRSTAAQFEALGGYFAERVADLRDVGSRAVAAVLGVPAPGVPDFSEPSVIVAEDLAPAETATLDRSLVVGIVTAVRWAHEPHGDPRGPDGDPGGRPARRGHRASPPGTPVALDGDTGEVTIAPDIALVEAQRVRLREAGGGPCGRERAGSSRRDGHHVALLANIGGVQDAEAAGALDLEGVGLFRTEFVFLSAERAPRSRSRRRSTGRSSRRSAPGAWSSARWMPAPTSR